MGEVPPGRSPSVERDSRGRSLAAEGPYGGAAAVKVGRAGGCAGGRESALQWGSEHACSGRVKAHAQLHSRPRRPARNGARGEGGLRGVGAKACGNLGYSNRVFVTDLSGILSWNIKGNRGRGNRGRGNAIRHCIRHFIRQAGPTYFFGWNAAERLGNAQEAGEKCRPGVRRCDTESGPAQQLGGPGLGERPLEPFGDPALLEPGPVAPVPLQHR